MTRFIVLVDDDVRDPLFVTVEANNLEEVLVACPNATEVTRHHDGVYQEVYNRRRGGYEHLVRVV